jgi:hypothetical protein
VITDRLVRDLFGLHRIVQRGTSGGDYQLFTLPHGEWIRLLGRCALVTEDLIEVRVPPGATNVISPAATGNDQVQALVYFNGWMCDAVPLAPRAERFGGELPITGWRAGRSRGGPWRQTRN